MPTEPLRTQHGASEADGTAPQQRAERPSAPAGASGDAVPGERPSDRRATATWIEASDASGTVRSRREMPEPDSLGG